MAVTEEVVSLREAAEQLGVHYMTAYRYVRLGILPAAKVGAAWHVRTADLAAFQGAADEPDATDRSRRVAWHERLEDRLMAGDAGGAWSVVEAALASGMDVRDIYVKVLTPALRSIGTRWHEGTLDIATEHRASNIAHRIIGRLGHRMVRRGRTRGTIVIGTPPGELHFLPVAMLGDLLRSGGWEVMDLGCDLPAESFVKAASGADRLVALGVSVTSPTHLAAAEETVSQLRAAFPETPILVGGAAVDSEDHARKLGADHWAVDGVAALEVVEALQT